MPNFRTWTASEIVIQMPEARSILTKHFGPEGLGSASGSELKDLARRRDVDIELVMRDLNALAKDRVF